MGSNPQTGTDPPSDPNATVLIGDEVASVVDDALVSAEEFTHAAVKLPFSAARLAVDRLRKAADALEATLRKAGGPKA